MAFKFFVLFVFVLLLQGCIQGNSINSKTDLNSSLNEFCFSNQKCIQIETALTESERMNGLMFRETLPETQGMLFVFPESKVYSFWMKNTLIPLDLIWINESKEIIDLTENFQPCIQDPCPSKSSSKPVKYVLEVNAGFVENNKIKIGEKVLFDLSD